MNPSTSWYWPHHLCAGRLTLTASPSPTLSRLLIADVVSREAHDLPMPGMCQSYQTRPFTTLVFSNHVGEMHQALVAADVHGVDVVPMPILKSWAKHEEAIQQADLVVIDDLVSPDIPRCRDVILYLRVLARRTAAVWVHRRATRRAIDMLADDGIMSRIAQDERGRVLVGVQPQRGVKTPAPLVADIVDGRLAWLDPFTVTRDYRTEVATTGYHVR